MLSILMITEKLNQANFSFIFQSMCVSLSCSLDRAVQVHEFICFLTSYPIPCSGATEDSAPDLRCFGYNRRNRKGHDQFAGKQNKQDRPVLACVSNLDFSGHSVNYSCFDSYINLDYLHFYLITLLTYISFSLYIKHFLILFERMRDLYL